MEKLESELESAMNCIRKLTGWEVEIMMDEAE
jgi:hypothetical protein